MLFKDRTCKHKNSKKGSVIFLEKKIFMDEIYTSTVRSNKRSLSKDFVFTMHELQNHFDLVMVQGPGAEESSADDLLKSLVAEAQIELFFQSHGTPVACTYVIHAGLKVSFSSDQRGHDASSLLPVTLTINFHNYGDVLSWILSHPNPYQNLLLTLLDGAEKIRRGDLVAFPTETVYGLGADATNSSAVEKIFSAKKRPLYDPLIVHVSDLDQMALLVTELPEKAEQLITRFWPGPLTMVLPKSNLVPSIVTAGTPSIAVRMPSNPIALELIRLSGKPIAAPSANLFGYTSPTTARHVEDQLGGAYATIIDGGACIVGIESTVISFLGETPRILRPGGIDQQSIESCIGPVLLEHHEKSDETLTSPGLMPSHYATSTPLWIVDNLHDYASRSDVGILLFGESGQYFQGPVEYLSRTSNPAEAANRLYQAMRRLDGLSLSLLVVKLLPETGIGVAVNNRLMKAATNSSTMDAEKP